ncbi:MAG: hypothetical protein ACRDI1_02170 [Actinomycetota bacterium]
MSPFDLAAAVVFVGGTVAGMICGALTRRSRAGFEVSLELWMGAGFLLLAAPPSAARLGIGAGLFLLRQATRPLLRT